VLAHGDQMTRDFVVFNLREAAAELSRTIDQIQADVEFDEAELRVAVAHIFHHLNTAWNARDATPERVSACSSKDFFAWRQFPADIDMDM